MTQFSDDPGADLRDLFFETSQELLQALNDEALKLEQHPGDTGIVRNLRRTVHTLKGDAAACGFHELSELAHDLEDALAAEQFPSRISLADIAFQAADTFNAMLTAYRTGGKLPSVASIKKTIRELTGKSNGKKSQHKKTEVFAPVVWSEYEKLAIQEASDRGKHVYQITAHIDPLCAMPMAARQLVSIALEKIGEVLGTRPGPGAEGSSKQLHLLLASHQTSASVESSIRIPTIISEVNVQTIGERKAPDQEAETTVAVNVESSDETVTSAPLLLPEAGSDFAPSLETSSTSTHIVAAENTLRVDSGRIDTVLNLVGELIIGKSMLQQALNELAVLHPKEAIRGKFADAMAFQSRVLGDLQRSVMKVRMVPVEQLFRRFPRMVRDVGKRCGKNVELVMNGQDTDLDKSLLDAIAEPLTHIVRNAVSHGIESAEERKSKGKPERGVLRLDAYHHANHVIISIADDGGGIDLQKVKTKAVEQGIISAAEVARLSDTETLNLVFRPGFTTAEEITEVSGRGVGLDIVQSVLQRLKGTVEIDTRPGLGTTFRLKLPLTLAIIKALLFRVEQRLYAIPLNAVAEITRGYESDLHRVESYEVLQLRNQVLPIVRMGRGGEDRTGDPRGKIFVLVIAFGERKLGLIVDSLEGEEELVIKALDDQTVTTDLVSGASILGDGRVVLIMNLAAIIERFSKSFTEDRGSLATSGLLLSPTERTHFATMQAGASQ
jgi:two-component system, chemotaxis family, sensor kinase CheA